MRRILLVALCLACASPAPRPTESAPAAGPGGQPAEAGDPGTGAPPSFAQPPPPGPSHEIDDGVPLAGGGRLTYLSDCSLTNPIARDTCSGAAVSDRGLASCASLGVTRGQACGTSSPSCYLSRACPDGRQAVADFLICAAEAPSRCMTRSSRRYKNDVHYLSGAEVQDLARQIEALPLATFRYDDQVGYQTRLGFLTEDAPAAPFVSQDGRTVDLYALLAASIAAIQAQDARIRALEDQVRECRAPGQD